MAELHLLSLVLVLLYLSECVAWVPRGSVALRANCAGGFRVVNPSRLFGNERGGLVFLNPLPPLCTYFVCPNYELCLSARAIYCFPVGWNDAAVPPAARGGRCVRFDQIHGIWASGCEVLIDRRTRLSFVDGERAESMAGFLVRLWQNSEAERNPAIAQAIDGLTNTSAIVRRLAQFDELVGLLRLWCYALGALLLCVIPASAWVWRLRANWAAIGAATMLCLGGVLVSFHRAHHRLYPRSSAARWRALATMVLTPTAAIRACDALGRRLLQEYHPVCTACVVCEPPALVAYARRVLLDLKHPLPTLRRPSDGPQCDQTEREFRERLQRALFARLADWGYAPEQLIAPPQRSDPRCIAFCPRCDQQFERFPGECLDCGGIRLRPFDAFGLPVATTAGRV